MDPNDVPGSYTFGLDGSGKSFSHFGNNSSTLKSEKYRKPIVNIASEKLLSFNYGKIKERSYSSSEVYESGSYSTTSWEEKFKQYVFGHGNTLDSPYNSKNDNNVTVIEETNSDISIVNSSDNFLDSHFITKNSDKIKQTDDKFKKILDDTTNIMKNSFCVTPKCSASVSKDIYHNFTPRKKLFSRNNGSFDDKENNFTEYDIGSKKSNISQSSFVETIVDSWIELESNRNSLALTATKKDFLEPEINTSSPLIRNETKRRKVNGKLVIPSEYKLDEYVNSPIHKTRDCENYFTDSDDGDDKVDHGENLKFESTRVHELKTVGNLPNIVTKPDISPIAKVSNLENYFTDSDEEASARANDHETSLKNSKTNEVCSETENSSGYSDLENSFDEIIIHKKRNKINPLNYSSESNSSQDNLSKNNSVDKKMNKGESLPSSGSIRIETSDPLDQQDIIDSSEVEMNNKSITTRKSAENPYHSDTSRNTDFISSIFLDSSVKNEDPGEKTSDIEFTKLQTSSDLNSPEKNEFEVIDVSDSSEDVTQKDHFHGDSFDLDEYFNKIRAESEPTPVQKPKSVDLISNVSIPSYSRNVDHTSFLLSLSSEVETFMCHPDADKYKTSFQKYKDELTAILFKVYNKEIFDNQLPFIEIIWSGHLTTTAGITKSSTKINQNGVKERKSSIKLSKTVTKDAAKLRDVLLHEMCHVACWLIDEQSDGHGPLFRKWVNKAYQRFPDVPKVTKCHRYELNYKYKYRCTFCKTEVGRMKLVVKDFSCRLCGGRVVVDCK